MLIQSDLQSLDNFLRESIKEPKSSLITEISEYIVCAGGKRIRPQILILLTNLFEYTGGNHIKLAAVIELIHTATLLHDDVIDNSDMRRNRVTAHVKWGRRCSITVGDWLFARAFKIVTTCQDNDLLKIIARMTKDMTKGELNQLYYKKQSKYDNYSEQAYIDIIKAKTGLLFEASCELAAVLSKQPQNIIENTKLFGLHLGLAFQIKDDLLDYLGHAQDLGKNIGDDLLEGKITLPLIYLRQRDFNLFKKILAEKNNLQKDVDTQEFRGFFNYLIETLNNYNCIQDSHIKAQEHVDLALKYLNLLPKNNYRDYLAEITHKVVKRDY